jgi:hypothetical protein
MIKTGDPEMRSANISQPGITCFENTVQSQRFQLSA